MFKRKAVWLFVLLVLGGSGAACQSTPQPTPEATQPAVVETATPATSPFPESREAIQFITIALDAPSRNRDFTDIDEFGRVQGFDPGVAADLAARIGIDVEFVVTGFEGVLDSVAQGEFDAAMSGLIISDPPPPGITFTTPYLEVGQVLVVRANERGISSVNDLPAEAVIGVRASSTGEQIAREIVGIAEDNLRRYGRTPQALQALIDRQVDGVILDSDDAIAYTGSYYQQLKIAGGDGPDGWITNKQYGIAVAADNQILLDLLNQAIEQARESGTIESLVQEWLVPQDRLVAGESLIGTLDREFVIGMVAGEINLDPAANPEPLSWELKTNTMAGLVGFTIDNELTPLLASDFPVISPDGLEYTFTLREGLSFPDGSPLTADDVVYSLRRSVVAGNFLVNALLKDANIDGFADEDAVQAVDERTVRILLDEPASYFLSLLATPPYFIVSDECFPQGSAADSICGGIGPYVITDWEAGQQMRLKANPQWPGPPPSFENVQVRFYDDAARMRRAVEIGAIDLAWLGLPLSDLLSLGGQPDYKIWQGPAAFKSYLVFEHQTAPWNNVLVRRAAALSVDREALSALFQGVRQPLFSPVPDQVWGHVATEPDRDLEQAVRLLEQAGYTAETPARITIDFVSDGRYSPFEAQYAAAIEAQLEETGVFDVTLAGAPYDAFRQKTVACESGAFLLGWPPSGQPPNYNDPYHWIFFFLFNTDSLCSNYESATMEAAMTSMEQLNPVDFEGRAAAYERIQRIWAEEVPTLDLTQELRIALSLNKVTAVHIDALGLLRYDALSKE